MNRVTLVVLLLCSSGRTGTGPASAASVHSPEEVTTVHNGTTGTACGVPTIKPSVPACLSDGLGIVNGEEAVPNSWPWQVSLQTDSGFHFCGGSLINKDWVVTAAHCPVSISSTRVILGQHSLLNANNIQTMRIGKVFSHPEYNDKSINYDMKLIKLQSPAEMNNNVSTVCLGQTSDRFYAGMKCVATGWGRTRYNPPVSPRDLQQVCLTLMGSTPCKKNFFRSLTNLMVCAGGAGSVVCNGDSGGPLVCEKNGAWTLVGVSSYVQTGCITDAPGVFAYVPNLRAWMDRTITDN